MPKRRGIAWFGFGLQVPWALSLVADDLRILRLILTFCGFTGLLLVGFWGEPKEQDVTDDRLPNPPLKPLHPKMLECLSTSPD